MLAGASDFPVASPSNLNNFSNGPNTQNIFSIDLNFEQSITSPITLLILSSNTVIDKTSLGFSLPSVVLKIS